MFEYDISKFDQNIPNRVSVTLSSLDDLRRWASELLISGNRVLDW